MPRVGEGRAPASQTGSPYTPSSLSPSSLSSFSSAPYLSPRECDDNVEGAGRIASKSNASSSTVPQTGPPPREGETVRTTDNRRRSVSLIPPFSYSVTTNKHSSSACHSPLQEGMQERTGTRRRNQRTAAGPVRVPDSRATLAKGAPLHTRASARASSRRAFQGSQSSPPVFPPPRPSLSLSSPITPSLQATALPTSPPPPPPPPRTHYQFMHPFEYRCRLSNKMRTLYGGSTVPVIVEPAESHLRLSPSSSSLLHSEAKPSSDSVSSGYAKGARLSCSNRAGASVVAPSPSSVSATPSTKSTLKCILPRTKSVAEVILTLRDRLALDSCQSVFLSVGENDVLVPGNSLLGDLYERHRHPDGFLYLGYLLENTFGGDACPGVGEAATVF